MSRTITRMFDSYSDAQQAVTELRRLGVDDDDVSLIANNADGSHGEHREHSETAEDAGKGAATGGLIGGAGGLLAGLGMLAIPGLGPVVAAGWLASTLVGAGVGAAVGGTAGGIVGALKDNGESEDDAHVYAEGVRRGGTLLSARVPDELAAEAEAVLTRHRSVDAATRGRAYREQGWNRFDESAPSFTRDQIRQERARYSALDGNDDPNRGPLDRAANALDGTDDPNRGPLDRVANAIDGRDDAQRGPIDRLA
jgi:hypothetical protein